MSGWCVRFLALVVCLHYIHGHPENYEYIQSIDGQIQELADDLNESLEYLEDDVLDVKHDLKKSRSVLERRIKKGLRDAQVSWEAKLNNELIPLVLPTLVNNAVAEVFRGHSLDKTATDAYKSELLRLKRTINTVKGQMYQFQRDVEVVWEENDVLRKTIEKMDEDFAVYKNSTRVCDCVQGMGKRTSLESPETSTSSSAAVKETSLTTTSSTDVNDVAVSPTTDTPKTNSDPVIDSSTGKGVDIQKEATGLLVVPYARSNNASFFTLSISAKYAWGREYVIYPLALQHVLSVAYVSSRKLLLLSTFNPDRIVVSPLFQPQANLSVLKEDVPASGMAIDEEKQLVFHTHWRWKTVNRIGVGGKSYKRLAQISAGHGPLISIALDVKNGRIYTCDNVNIYAIPYNGGNWDRVLGGSSLSALAFDTLPGILYFSDNHKVMKYYPGNGTRVTIANLSFSPRTFQLHKKFADTLLLSSHDGGIIDIIYLMDQYPRYHLPQPKSWVGHLICLIHLPERPPVLSEH